MTTIDLRYEVLRREDGAIAVSMDAGQLAFVPYRCRLEGGSVAIFNGPSHGAWLRNVPSDVTAAVAASGSLLCFAFNTAGIAAEYRLRCEVLSP